MLLQLALTIAISYLVGAVPAGYLVGKLVKGIDIRDYGSGKTGTTNTLRTLGLGWAAVVLLADFAKGFLPVLAARYLLDSNLVAMAGGLAAIVGHNWPIFIRFQGGRGAATGFGALVAMSPVVAVVCALLTGGVVALFRYVSLGTILGAIAVPLVMLSLVLLGWETLDFLIYAALGASLVIFQHRDNMARLLAGKERRLGEEGEGRRS